MEENKWEAQENKMLIINNTHWGSWGASRASISSWTNDTLDNRRGRHLGSILSHLETHSHHFSKPHSYQADMAVAL